MMNLGFSQYGVLSAAFMLCGAVLFGAGESESEVEGNDFVMYWNSNHRYSVYEDVINTFADENGLTVDLQTFLWPDMRTKLLADFAAGTVADMIQVPAPWLLEFGSNGLMADLSDRINAWPDASDWFESTWIEVTSGAKRYGVKNHHTTFGLFYNKDIFRKAGLDPDSPPADLTEFRDMTRRVSEELGPDILGFAFDQDPSYLVNFFVNAEVENFIVDNRITMGTPEVIRSLEILQEIAANGWALIAEPGANYQNSRRAFIEGGTAMMLSGPWDLANLAQNAPEMDYGITVPPHLEGVEPRTSVAGTAIGIPVDAGKPDSAWELLTRLTAADIQVAATMEAGMLMPRRSWAAHPDVQGKSGVSDFAKILPYATPYGIEASLRGLTAITWGTQGDLTQILYQNIIYNRTPAADAVRDYVESGNQLLR